MTKQLLSIEAISEALNDHERLTTISKMREALAIDKTYLVVEIRGVDYFSGEVTRTDETEGGRAVILAYDLYLYGIAKKLAASIEAAGLNVGFKIREPLR